MNYENRCIIKIWPIALHSFPTETRSQYYQSVTISMQVKAQNVPHKLLEEFYNFFLWTMTLFLKSMGALNLYQMNLLPNLFSNYWYMFMKISENLLLFWLLLSSFWMSVFH